MTRRKPEIERAAHTKLRVAPIPPPKAIPVPCFAEILGDASGAVALAEFNRISPLLTKMGSASALDVFLLREYCVVWARLLEIEKRITADGLMVPGQRDSLVKHPLIQAACSYRNSSRTLCAQLGVGASSRGQMSLTPPKHRDLPEAGAWLPYKVTETTS